MSMTREEWVALWNAVKRMEYLANELPFSGRKKKMLNEIHYMKAQIQAVIGQME